MKYIFPLILFSFLLIVTNTINHNNKTTEVTLSIPKLESLDLANHLQNEFKKNSKMDFIDQSLTSKTVVLRVNENSFNISDVQKLLNKWGVEASDINYRKLYELENY